MKQKLRKKDQSLSDRRTKIGSRQEETNFEKQQARGHLRTRSKKRAWGFIFSFIVTVESSISAWLEVGHGNEGEWNYSKTKD